MSSRRKDRQDVNKPDQNTLRESGKRVQTLVVKKTQCATTVMKTSVNLSTVFWGYIRVFILFLKSTLLDSYHLPSQIFGQTLGIVCSEN